MNNRTEPQKPRFVWLFTVQPYYNRITPLRQSRACNSRAVAKRREKRGSLSGAADVLIKNPVDDSAYGLINSSAIYEILVIGRTISNIEGVSAASVPFREQSSLKKI